MRKIIISMFIVLSTLITPISAYEIDEIPEYSGNPYVEIHDNVPIFSSKDMNTKSFESYSNLDSLDRPQVAYANVSKDLMPTKKRESIGSVKPAGWHTVRYKGIDGKYLYNRCHLIGYQLTGENANRKNLMTGTRYLNVEGMLPLENKVSDYIKKTNHHVLYRVTPIYDGDNLIADGVQIEAYSVEDKGQGVSFNVFCYNVQPGITIDYKTGDSSRSNDNIIKEYKVTEDTSTYVLNVKTHKFHKPTCASVRLMNDVNMHQHGVQCGALQRGNAAAPPALCRKEKRKGKPGRLPTWLKVHLKTKEITDISQPQAGCKAKSHRNPFRIPRLFKP